MKPDKTPGLDGFTCEFYLHFFEQVKTPLLNMHEQSYQRGHLTQTSKQGVIELIPEKLSSNADLKSWRPFTIFYYDYKILARVLAMRMEAVNDKLIGPDQNGFLKNCSTYFNIRTVAEVIAHANKT